MTRCDDVRGGDDGSPARHADAAKRDLHPGHPRILAHARLLPAHDPGGSCARWSLATHWGIGDDDDYEAHYQTFLSYAPLAISSLLFHHHYYHKNYY